MAALRARKGYAIDLCILEESRNQHEVGGPALCESKGELILGQGRVQQPVPDVHCDACKWVAERAMCAGEHFTRVPHTVTR